MALEFTKLSEVTLTEGLSEEATVVVENNGEIVRAPMNAIKSDNDAILVILTQLDDYGYDHLMGKMVNDEIQYYETEADFLMDYTGGKKLLLNFTDDNNPYPYPALIQGYGMDGYGEKCLFWNDISRGSESAYFNVTSSRVYYQEDM